MKIEKKTIALCLIALVTGIAIVLPIAYDRGIIITVQTNSLFNIDVLYANATDTTVGAIINITTTSNVAKLKNSDVRMEIYNFHFYSDQASIANVTYTIDVPAVAFFNGQNVVTVGSHLPGSIAITDKPIHEPGTVIDYSTIISNTAGIGGYTFQRDEKSHIMGIGACLSGESYPITLRVYLDGETVTIPAYVFSLIDQEAIDNLRNAQTLYIEVTRIMSVSYQYPLSNVSTTSSTTTILANNEVVAHIELTKVDGGFVYGNYEQIVEATGGDVIINYNSQPLISWRIPYSEDE